MKSKMTKRHDSLWHTAVLTVKNLIKNLTHSFKTQKEDFFHSVNRAKFSTKLIVGAVIVVFVMIGVLSVTRSLASISAKEKTVAEYDAKINELKEDNEKLKADISGDMEQAIEDKAREELDMVYPGEQVFINTAG